MATTHIDIINRNS